MKYYIYIHKNKVNGKVYIGQTCQSPERRWRKSGEGYKDSPAFWNAIQKYGWPNFSHEILEEVEAPLLADEREKFWISFYQSNNEEYGYNLTPGGGATYMKELWQDPEYKNKMKETFSKTRKEKFKNEKYKEERLAPMLKGIKEFWENPEKRQKRIEEITLEGNPNSKKVINLNTLKVFNTLKEAAEWAGLKTTSQICECCRGQAKTAGSHPISKERLLWEYYIENKEYKKQKPNKSLSCKPVKCLNTNQIFDSITEAASWAGLSTGSSIYACCKGKQKTAGSHPVTKERLSWQYVNTERGVIKE